MRAERAGYSAIFLTADVPVVGKRRAQSYNPSIFPSHIQSVWTVSDNSDQVLAITKAILQQPEG